MSELLDYFDDALCNCPQSLGLIGALEQLYRAANIVIKECPPDQFNGHISFLKQCVGETQEVLKTQQHDTCELGERPDYVYGDWKENPLGNNGEPYVDPSDAIDQAEYLLEDR